MERMPVVPDRDQKAQESPAKDLPQQVNDDIAGVQGAAPNEDSTTPVQGAQPGQGQAKQPAPDAGEVEWAGQVVKKPPHPDGAGAA